LHVIGIAKSHCALNDGRHVVKCDFEIAARQRNNPVSTVVESKPTLSTPATTTTSSTNDVDNSVKNTTNSKKQQNSQAKPKADRVWPSSPICLLTCDDGSQHVKPQQK
jgi:hypothetical protein